ncbi:MAG: methyltransferase domain-containing protein [Natronomonas sp.]
MIDEVFEALREGVGTDADVYGLLAPVYRTVYTDWERIDGQATAVTAAAPDAETIAEIGCGSGDLCARLTSEYDRVIGLDPSPEMVQLARQTADSSICRGSAGAIAPQSVDAVVMLGAVIGHIHPEGVARNVLQEAATALRPGGRLILSAHNAGHVADGRQRELTTTTSEYRITQRDQWQSTAKPGVFEWQVEYELTQLTTEDSVEANTSVSIRAFDEATLREWLTDAGFQITEFRPRWYVDGEAERAFVTVAERPE